MGKPTRIPEGLKTYLAATRTSRENLIEQSNKLLRQYLEEESPKKEAIRITEYLKSKENTRLPNIKHSPTSLDATTNRRTKQRQQTIFPRLPRTRLPQQPVQSPGSQYPQLSLKNGVLFKRLSVLSN